jgi:flavin-dependent dehydrogenase
VLAGAGASVVLFERSTYDGSRIGETLPPEVRVPLDRLGVWDRFLADGHARSPGIVAAWGTAEPYANDFVLNPYGCGWRVDRNRFDEALAGRAEGAGAVVRTGVHVDRCRLSENGMWELPGVVAGFLVEATGRSPSFAGARRVVHDRMVAVVGLALESDEDERALIEATEHGWWYAARLPDGRLVMAFQTDPRPDVRGRWDEFLSGAPLTAARARGPAGGVRVVAANSHRSDPMAGKGWLAVGDAAAAHDPIAGLGIQWALESGIAGAEAIIRGDRATYAHNMNERFTRYLTTRAHYYRAETRWPDAPFWRGRRQPLLESPGPRWDLRP